VKVAPTGGRVPLDVSTRAVKLTVTWSAIAATGQHWLHGPWMRQM
jgi:hypothetical protein